MKHYIYRIDVIENGEYYIGVRSHEHPNSDKYIGSGEKIKEYRTKGFTLIKTILSTFDNRKDASIQESIEIRKHIGRPGCLNIISSCTGNITNNKSKAVYSANVGRTISNRLKHYVYRIDVQETGEFYIGSRSHSKPEVDRYMGSGKLITERKKDGYVLSKTILSIHDNRSDANNEE